MESTTGLIPEDMMHASELQRVIAFLVAQPIPGYMKREYFFGWAHAVNVRLSHDDVVIVETSGPAPEGRQ